MGKNIYFLRVEKSNIGIFLVLRTCKIWKKAYVSKLSKMENMAFKFFQVLKSLQNVKEVNKINFICHFTIFAQNKVCLHFLNFLQK
jgi:hypothetical protein